MINQIQDTPIFDLYTRKLNLLVARLRSANNLTQIDDIYRDFLDSVRGPLNDTFSIDFSKFYVKCGDQINTNYLDDFAKDTIYQISSIYQQLLALNRLMTRGFNQIAVEESKAITSMKKIDSAIGSYKLFNTNFHDQHIYVAESFNNSDGIDINSQSIISKCGTINPVEGLVTLNYEQKDIANYVIQEITINEGNGQLGNNWDLNRPINNNLLAILDNNPDTWVEYELVTLKTTEVPLELSLTCKLDKLNIINHIELIVNNFGTENWVTIKDLQTSLDGIAFTSIKDQIPNSDWTADTDPFLLAPSGSKYEGMGSYSFYPRSAQYIKVVLEQPNYYSIQTDYGYRLRYAIGIRDILIQGISYADKSEVVSKQIQLDTPIRKLALLSNQIPVTSNELCKVNFEISIDSGTTWYPIAPIDSTIPYVQTSPSRLLSYINNQFPVAANAGMFNRILNFNTGDEGSIETPQDVTQFSWRIKLEKLKDNFKSAFSIFSKILGRKYLNLGGIKSSVQFNNDYKPENLLMHFTIAPMNRSVIIGQTQPIAGLTYSTIPLPYYVYGAWDPLTFFGENGFLIVKVNEECWTLAPNNVFVDNTSQHFRIDNGSLIFGDSSYDDNILPDSPGNAQDYYYMRSFGGKSPGVGASVSLRVTWGTAKIISKSPLKAKLSIPSNMNKENTYLTIDNLTSVAVYDNLVIPPATTTFIIDSMSDYIQKLGTGAWEVFFYKNYEVYPTVSMVDNQLSITGPFMLQDQGGKYIYLPRKYIDGSTEFCVLGPTGQSLNIHDVPSTGPSRPTNYLPISSNEESRVFPVAEAGTISNLTGTGATGITGVGTEFLGLFSSGDKIIVPAINGETGYIDTIISDTYLTVTGPFSERHTHASYIKENPDLTLINPGDNITLLVSEEWGGDSWNPTPSKIPRFYSIKPLEGESQNKSIQIYFSKAIASDTQVMFPSSSQMAGWINKSYFEYSTDPTELGTIINLQSDIYRPVTQEYPLYITEKCKKIQFPTNLIPGTITFPTNAPNFKKEVSFIDGTKEFNQPDKILYGMYSIDYDHGIIYMSDYLPASDDPYVFKYHVFQLDVLCDFGYNFTGKSTITGSALPVFMLTSVSDKTWDINLQNMITTGLFQVNDKFSLAVSFDNKIIDSTSPEKFVPFYSPLIKDIALITLPTFANNIPKGVLSTVYQCPILESVTIKGNVSGFTVTGQNLTNVIKVKLTGFDISGDVVDSKIVEPGSWYLDTFFSYLLEINDHIDGPITQYQIQTLDAQDNIASIMVDVP